MAKETEIVTRVTAKLKKETAGTYVYADESDDSDIPTIYIKKKAFEGAPPKSIKIIIKA